MDRNAEAKCPEMKRQPQELGVLIRICWCRSDRPHHAFLLSPPPLGKPPTSLAIRDGFEKNQFICVEPIVDLYGRFAAEKLAQLIEMYPNRAYSKPEFTAPLSYLFSESDFTLIPSRDEPFGLVVVESGRRGALVPVLGSASSA